MPTLQQNNIFAERYLLQELIASRGVSEVWKAEDMTAEGTVRALKIYAPENTLDEVVLHQIRSEYAISRSLDSPYLTPIYDFEIYQGTPYLVMPFSINGSLNHNLIEQGPLPETEVAILMKQVGRALRYLHSQQPPILHEDVKPDNILLTDDGGYSLSEIGLSTRTRNALHRATGKTYSPTMGYASPERFAAQPIHNEAGDIFSFGVTLYEACTGELPWMGSGGLGLLRGAEVPYLPGPYSRVLSNIMRACLNEDWEKRPTAEQLVQEADFYLENGTWRTSGPFGIVIAEVIDYKKRSSLLEPILYGAAILFALLSIGYLVLVDSPTLQSLKSNFGGGEDSETIAIVQSNASMTAAGSQIIQPTASNAKEPAFEKTMATSEAAPAAESNKPAETRATETKPVETKKVQVNDEAASSPSPAKPKAATTDTNPATGKKPRTAASYPKPTTLQGYLNELTNEEVPLEVKNKWKPQIRNYFTSDAVIYYVVNGSVVTKFGLNDMIDILLSTDSTSNVSIEDVKENETGKVEQLHLLVYHY